MTRDEIEKYLADISERYERLADVEPATDTERDLSEWVETLRAALISALDGWDGARNAALEEAALECERPEGEGLWSTHVLRNSIARDIRARKRAGSS